MTKIKELNNTQLLQNIEKYQKTLSLLQQERERRIKTEPALKKTLYSKKEVSPQTPSAPTPPSAKKQPEAIQEEPRTTEGSDANFQINFKDSELEQINKETKQEQQKNHSEEESVGMTEVLELTEDQIKEFNKAKIEKKEKKEK